MNWPTCRNCGKARHIFQWACPLDLHGEPDPFKTSCCMCEEEIPSGAPRESDPFGNLYCSRDCLITGQLTLMQILQEQGEQIDIDAERIQPQHADSRT